MNIFSLLLLSYVLIKCNDKTMYFKITIFYTFITNCLAIYTNENNSVAVLVRRFKCFGFV